MKMKVMVTDWSLRQILKSLGNNENVSMLPLWHIHD